MWSYPSFAAAFEVLTESKVDNPKECLYVLDQHTSGKAKELIKGCFLMKNEDSYKVAKKTFLETHTRLQVHTSQDYRAGPLWNLTTEQG